MKFMLNKGINKLNSKNILAKNTHFRSWKKGKVWLYASATILSIVGAGAASTSEVHADTVKPVTATSAASTSIGTATSSNASAAPATSDATSSSAATQETAKTVATVTPQIQTKSVTVNRGSSFNALSAFSGATDSKGATVGLSQIKVDGTVNTNVAGVYNLLFSFVDPATQETVNGAAQVTVQSDTATSALATPEVKTPASSVKAQADLDDTSATQTPETPAAEVAPSTGGMSFDAGSTATVEGQSSAATTDFSSAASEAMVSAGNALSSYAQTSEGKSAASQVATLLDSAAGTLSSVAALANDPAVVSFKAALSDAVAAKDTALAQSLVSSFYATSQGAALKELAANSATAATNPTDTAALASLKSMAADLTSNAAVSSSQAMAASSAASSYMATSDGQALLASAQATADKASAATDAAVSAFAETADGKAMLNALSSYAANPEFSAFNAAMSSAVAAKDTSAANSLASSFFATAEGSQFIADMNSYEATSAYKAMEEEMDKAKSDALSSVQTSISLASQTLAGSGFNPSSIIGDITGGIWNAVSWFATNVNPIKLVPDLTKMGQFGEFLESLLGATLGATFYGSVSALVTGQIGFLTDVPATILNSLIGIIPLVGIITNISTVAELGWVTGSAGWWGSMVATVMGAYYGGTMGPGLVQADGTVDNIVSGTALGATVGSLIGESIADWGLVYTSGTIIFGIAGVIAGVAGIIGLGPIVGPIVNLILGEYTPITLALSTLVGAPIGSLIGGALGGGIGALLQTMGISLHLPNASQLVKDIAALPGISDLLNIIKTVTEKTGTMVTKAVSIAKGAHFSALSGYTSATDSNGAAVPLSSISTSGVVNTSIPGSYIINYNYMDSGTKKIVNGYSVVTVTDGTTTPVAVPTV